MGCIMLHRGCIMLHRGCIMLHRGSIVQHRGYTGVCEITYHALTLEGMFLEPFPHTVKVDVDVFVCARAE